MKWFLNSLKTLISVYYAHMLEYRAEIFLWVLANSLPLILMGVWIQAASNGNFGLSAIDFARYFFTIFIIRQLTVVWMIWEFEKEIVEGTLSFRLLQPIHPVWHHVARHLSEKMTRIPFTIALIFLFFCLYPQTFWIPSLTNIILFCLGVILAFSFRFIIQYTFALCAFWTEKASAIEEFWFLFYIFLAGLIAPLDVFPPLIKELVLLTPFPYFLYIPAALLIGLPVNLVQSFLVISFWGILTLLMNRWLWHKGLKKYSGMGA